MDRATDYESVGRGFESSNAHQVFMDYYAKLREIAAMQNIVMITGVQRVRRHECVADSIILTMRQQLPADVLKVAVGKKRIPKNQTLRFDD